MEAVDLKEKNDNGVILSVLTFDKLSCLDDKFLAGVLYKRFMEIIESHYDQYCYETQREFPNQFTRCMHEYTYELYNLNSDKISCIQFLNQYFDKFISREDLNYNDQRLIQYITYYKEKILKEDYFHYGFVDVIDDKEKKTADKIKIYDIYESITSNLLTKLRRVFKEKYALDIFDNINKKLQREIKIVFILTNSEKLDSPDERKNIAKRFKYIVEEILEKELFSNNKKQEKLTTEIANICHHLNDEIGVNFFLYKIAYMISGFISDDGKKTSYNIIKNKLGYSDKIIDEIKFKMLQTEVSIKSLRRF